MRKTFVTHEIGAGRPKASFTVVKKSEKQECNGGKKEPAARFGEGGEFKKWGKKNSPNGEIPGRKTRGSRDRESSPRAREQDKRTRWRRPITSGW